MKNCQTGIIYDPIFLKHDQPGHPENAKRLESIIDGLERKRFTRKEVKKLESRYAEIDEITLCHSQDYVEYVKEFCEKGWRLL